MNDKIIIKGAREHNLKNINLELPRNKLIVITGVSGSGKSSLAFDTIYAEGQRRYIESLSAYARQFLSRLEKPDVEYIEGLSPAIAIEQRKSAKNPRSTVATITEIYDYLRLLFARIAKPHCYLCKKPISGLSIDEILENILKFKEGSKLEVLAPVVRGRKGEYQSLFSQLYSQGFVRVRVDNKMYSLEEDTIKLEKYKQHTIEVVVDRIILKEGIRSRLAEAVETATKLTQGIVTINLNGKEHIFSEKLTCVDCGISYPEVSPRIFSFNSPYGACKSCSGLGARDEFSEELIIDESKSIKEGAIRPFSQLPAWKLELTLKALNQLYNVRLDTPFKNLTKQERNLVLYGTDDGHYYRSKYGDYRYTGTFEGIIPWLKRRYKETDSEEIKETIEKYMVEKICEECKGARLRKESLSFTIQGLSIADVVKLSVKEAYKFFNTLWDNLSEREKLITEQVLKEIRERLKFLLNVGVDYLTLDRKAETLSGGEAQRIQLATQIGSGLVGVVYILDEPSIGLHQRDNKRLLDTLCKLRDLGNTLIVVEHDEATIRKADYIVDLGPGAGDNGGYVVAAGSIKDIINSKDSLTGKYLKGERKIPIPQVRKKPDGRYLKIIGACKHNLKKINVKIPLGLFTCITGVSGSGKSTLINELLYPSLLYHLHRTFIKPEGYYKIEGLEYIDKVIDINQNPIGRTPRSNPATYTGLFTYVRELFAELPQSKARGYKQGRFSFNVKGGRCEACQGEGTVKIEMHFLADVYVTCEVCKGKRYNHETLQVEYKGKNIADILEMSVDEALEFFDKIPQIKHKLKTLQDVGLGYIKLGQSATTLSGGEAQRVKLATELSKRPTGKTLYLLDEPTTGLHFADIQKLLDVLLRLRDAGNTIVVIEHNPDVIKTADYIIDLGPEGGDEGGYIVGEGTPEELAENKNSYTGLVLKDILKK
jgi:excinuclease ABC subunit A